MGQYHVEINTDRCIGCGLCSEICVAHNLVISQNKARKVMDDCVMCGQCSAVCPKKAIGVPKGKKVAMTLVLGYPNIKFLRSTPHKELDVRYM